MKKVLTPHTILMLRRFEKPLLTHWKCSIQENLAANIE